LNLSNTGAMGFNSQSGARTLTLTGTNAGNNTLAAAIGDYGVGAATALTKAGTGTWVLTGANTYTGATTVSAGTLSFSTIKDVNGGASALGAPTNATDGTIAIGAGTVGGVIKYVGVGGTSFASTNRAINLAGTTGGATIDQSGPPGTLTFTSDFTATGSGAKTLTLQGSTSGTGVISGKIVDSTGGATSLTKAGTGTWTLSGANTYTGTTTVSAGTLAYGANDVIATGAVTVSGGTLSLGIYSDEVGTVTVSTSGSITGSGTLTSTGTFEMKSGTVSAILAGAVPLNKTTTASTVTVNSLNTYTGATTISAGILSVGTLGGGSVASALGQSSDDAANLVLNGGTLKYTGGAATSTRLFSVGASGGTIDASGAGVLNLSNTGSMGFVSTGARTLTLTGTSTGANTLAAVIGDNSGATSLTKTSTGTWALSGASTYTGATTVSAGVLSFNTINNAGTSSALGANGTISIGSTTTAGTIVYTGSGNTSNRVINLAGTTGGATIDQSGTGTLTFTSDFTATGSGAKTLTLQGSTAGAGVISGKIVNSTSATSLVKTGTGAWTLSGASTYTGSTTVSGGILEALDGAGLPTDSHLILNGGVFQSHGTLTRALSSAGTGTVHWTAGGGFAAAGGTLNVSLSGSTTLSWGYDSGFIAANQTLILGSATADSLVNFQNGINLYGAARTIQVDDNPLTDGDVARISAAIMSDGGAGTGALVKTGAGVLELSAENTYSGGTTVTAGTLKVTGTIGDVLVKAGAKLTGNGQVGSVAVGEDGGDPGAIVAPGNSPGTLYVEGDYTMNDGSVYEWGLRAAGTAGIDYDTIAVTGNLTLDSTWTLEVLKDAGFGAGTYISPLTQFDIFTYTGFLSTALSGYELTSVDIVLASALADQGWNIDNAKVKYAGSLTEGGRVYLTGLQVGTGGAVPEPAALGLLGLALLALRKRRAA